MTNAAWITLWVLASIVATCAFFPGGRDFLKSWAKFVIGFTAIGLVVVGVLNLVKQCSHNRPHPDTEFWNRR